MNATEYYTKANIYINHDNDKLIQLDNAILGLCGEVGELIDYHKKNKYHKHPFVLGEFIEELGDLQWYVHLACYGMDVSFDMLWQLVFEDKPYIIPNNFGNRLLLMNSCVGKIGEIWSEVGVEALQSEALLKAIVIYLKLLCVHSLVLSEEVGLSIEGVWELNVTKLQTRYPGGFSYAHSINRTTLEAHP